MKLSIRVKTSLNSPVGTESKRQVVGLDDETSDVSSGRSIEDKRSRSRSAATSGSMVSGLDNISVMFMEVVDCFLDGYNFIGEEVHEIIASQSSRNRWISRGVTLCQLQS